jgi:subtilase family serine protease
MVLHDTVSYSFFFVHSSLPSAGGREMKRLLSAIGMLVFLILLVGGVGGNTASAAGPHVPTADQHSWVVDRDTGKAYRVAHNQHAARYATATPPGYTPTQVRQAYGFNLVSSNGSGQIVAIVDAYSDPTIAGDLQTFIKQFGLPGMSGLSRNSSCTVAKGPHPCFQIVYAQGKQPRTDGGWALEMSLDVEWTHAIAPGADILLVEAQDNSYSNLLGAVDVAANNGARAVSMSWGGSESSSESSHDSHFNKPGVTFTASSGDSGTGTEYPAASPYVVGVGGTTLALNGSETAWSGSSGGISAAESEPGYQSNYPIPSIGGMRGVPDVSYDADPNTGFPVYDSTRYNGSAGWFQVGGTSAGAPQWAALVALSNQGRKTALAGTAGPMYSAAQASYSGNYRDIKSGTNGTCGPVCTATNGYDFVTGLGSPLANSLIPYLQNH